MRKATALVAVLLVVAMLAIPVSAATPSVQQTAKPTVTVATTPANDDNIATKDAPKVEAPAEVGKITVTAVMDRDELPAEVKKEVEAAYKQITQAKTLDKAVPEMKTVLQEMKATVSASDLVVRDLFHVDVEKSEGTVSLSFDLDLKADDFIMVMRFVDGKWEIIDPELVKINDDGTVTVDFEDGVGTLAFVVEEA